MPFDNSGQRHKAPRSGEKGSKKCLQDYVNDDRGCRLADLIVCHSPSLSAFAPTTFEWKSPLAPTYLEYRDDFLKQLGFGQHVDAWKKFWPQMGPQWDALAVVAKNGQSRGIILVEAKAHPEEATTSSGAKDPASVARIRASLARTIGYFGAQVSDEEDWENGYYQLANRLAALYFLNEVARVPAWLVLINFVDDTSHRPTPLGEWRSHQSKMFGHLAIHPDSPGLARLVTLCIPAKCGSVEQAVSTSGSS